MATRYYSIPETLSLLSNKGLNLPTIASHIREKTIHPIIYIDSIPAHACELTEDGNTAIAIGLCHLSAYWDVGDQIIAIVDNLIKSRNGVIEIEPRVRRQELLGEPKILGWQYNPGAFTRLPVDMKNPKPYSDQLKIEYFVLLSQNKYPVDLSFINVVLSVKDFQFLRDECVNPTVQLGPHMVYHWSGDIKKVETNKEYRELLETKEWFDSPKKAWECKALDKLDCWTVRQACFYLCGQNPDPHDKNYTAEALKIHQMLDADYLAKKIKLEQKVNLEQKPKLTAKQVIFIGWAINQGLTLQSSMVEYYEKYKHIVAQEDEVNEQCFTRTGIKKTYDKLTEDQWKHYFKNEELNGLGKAKIQGSNARSDRYRLSGVERWLIENGHYSPKELQKTTGSLQLRPTESSMSDIVRMVQEV